MVQDGVPLTRERYLSRSFLTGRVPDELSADEEAELPPPFRHDYEHHHSEG